MQFTPVASLVNQCTQTLDRLEALQAKNPARIEPQPLFAISGLSSDLQRLYAVYLILTDLTAPVMQAEVAEAIGNLVETIGLTYSCRPTITLLSVDSPRGKHGGRPASRPRHSTSLRKGKVNA